MSVLSQSSPAALQAPGVSMPGPVCFTGWLPALLGRACGNTCETAIIMAFCLRVGGVRWQVCSLFTWSVRNGVPWDPILSSTSYLSQRIIQPPCWRHISSRVLCRPRRSTTKMSPTHLFHSILRPPPPADAVNQYRGSLSV